MLTRCWRIYFLRHIVGPILYVYEIFGMSIFVVPTLEWSVLDHNLIGKSRAFETSRSLVKTNFCWLNCCGSQHWLSTCKWVLVTSCLILNEHLLSCPTIIFAKRWLVHEYGSLLRKLKQQRWVDVTTPLLMMIKNVTLSFDVSSLAVRILCSVLFVLLSLL